MIHVEEIPNSCRLFYRVHKIDVRNNELVPGAFKERGEGEQKSMSTDWGKYSNAIESKNRATNPDYNGIVKFEVGSLRDIPLEVTHNPDSIKENPAHTDVKGIRGDKPTKTEIRLKLIELFQWEINLS